MPLSAAQIVTDACMIAKCPGFTAQGGRALNLALNDLALHRNLKANLFTQTITVGANTNGPFNLESNYGRAYDVFYLVSDEPFFLAPMSLAQYDAEPSKTTVSNYPDSWATDLSGVPTGSLGLLYIYPQSNTGLTLTHRYFGKRTDITTPESSSTVPWFEDQDYLIRATAMRLMLITDDARKEQFEKDCEDMLRIHLMTEGDEQQVVKSIQLDPRRFRVAGGLRPTKLNPW